MGELVEVDFGGEMAKGEFLSYMVCATCNFLFTAIGPKSLNQELVDRMEKFDGPVESPFCCPNCQAPSCIPVWRDLEGFKIVRYEPDGAMVTKIFPGRK